MDPVTLLWIMSLLGAAGFAATGYWYGRMKVAEEVAAAEERAKAAVHEATTLPPPTAEADAKTNEEADADALAAIEAATKAAEEKIARERAALEEKAAEEKAAADEALQQVAVLREELRVEILARTDAEKRASDLTSRLVSSSQQISALRAKLGPAAADVRSSMTPPAPRVSVPPTNPQRLQNLAPGLFGELEELRREVARLKSENETLRVAAFVKRSE